MFAYPSIVPRIAPSSKEKKSKILSTTQAQEWPSFFFSSLFQRRFHCKARNQVRLKLKTQITVKIQSYRQNWCLINFHTKMRITNCTNDTFLVITLISRQTCPNDHPVHNGQLEATITRISLSHVFQVYPGFTVHSFIIYAAISWFSEGLINWKIIERKMPWELVFLLGGGFALAKGTSASGLSAFLGVQLEALR